jgi:hypothetical protein
MASGRELSRSERWRAAGFDQAAGRRARDLGDVDLPLEVDDARNL